MKKTYEVVAAVIEKDGLIFCCQRGEDKSLPLKWEFPGGKIENNETHEQALIREIKEELKSLIEVKNHIISVYHEYETFNITLHAYYCILIRGNLQLTEHVNKVWIDRSKIDSLDWAEADVEIVKNVKINI